MREIAVNQCFGGFGLSILAEIEIAKRKNFKIVFHHNYDQLSNDEALALGSGFIFSNLGELRRDDPDLVAVIKELGDNANGNCAELTIREIPDDVDWGISEYDGIETIHEKHRSW